MSDEVKKPVWKRWWFWAIAVIIVIALAGGGEDETSKVTQNPVEQTAPVVSNEVVKKEPAAAAPAEKISTETLSQRNAVAKAKSYLNYSPFSKSGLTKQLEYEGFSNADATYAVDKIGF